MKKANIFKSLQFGLLIVAFLFIALVANFSPVYALTYDDYSNGNEEINVGKLAEIEEKYKSVNSAIFNDDEETPHDENAPKGTDNYTNYLNKNFYAKTTFNRITYFQNLSAYSPYNNIGSCGYVSLIQLLSYYDTFYNDRIIPEQYERKNETATTEAAAKLQSPGVLRQEYYASGYSSYYKYCNATMDSDLQSKLTVTYNKLNGSNADGTYNDGTPKFEYSTGAWLYQKTLNSFYGNSSTVKVNVYRSKTQTEYLSLIKETIGSGNPVIVHIKKYDSNGKEAGYHSVVAYSYDESGIYANFGWGSYANKYQLLGGNAGYTEIDTVATLDFSSLGHSHSNNYKINSKTYCGCNLSDELNFTVSMSWDNVPPTFYWMKNVYDADETFTISFKNSVNGTNIVSYTTSSNQMTVSVNAWSKILNQSNGKVYIEFKRNSGIVNYNSITYVFDKTTKSMQSISLSPAEYGYECRYYSKDDGAKNKYIIKDGYTIGTSRVRCGYIENEYIVLSARREEMGFAYLEYSFDANVYRIDVDLTLWSNNEMISPYIAEAYLQYKDNAGQWVTVLDLLNDITLSEDRTAPVNYTVVFPEITSEFRFYSACKYPNDRNKGRICIGDMSIYLEA